MIYSKAQLETFSQLQLEELVVISYKGMRNTFLPAEKRKAHSKNRDRAYVVLESSAKTLHKIDNHCDRIIQKLDHTARVAVVILDSDHK